MEAAIQLVSNKRLTLYSVPNIVWLMLPQSEGQEATVDVPPYSCTSMRVLSAFDWFPFFTRTSRFHGPTMKKFALPS